MDASGSIARHFANTQFTDLPMAVVEATKKEILDFLGVSLCGADQAGARELLELIREWGGKPESSLIGFNGKVPAPNAAHFNATAAHTLDFDDVHEYAVVHPGVAVIPTALAMAEQTGHLDGRTFITGCALGVDMMCRMTSAPTPGRSPVKTGWHLTTLFGLLGAAATAGKIMQLPEQQLVYAMGIAYHQSSGNGQAVIDGTHAKRLGPGFSVRGGIVSALLAGKGVTGAVNSLEGENGLFKQYFQGDYDPTPLTKDLGQFYEGVNVAIKPYPCCRGIHPAIDSALALVKAHSVIPDDIASITIHVSDDHRYLLCQPEEAKLTPRNPVDSQFSLPWGVATAMVKGRVTLDDFTPAAISDPAVLAVTSKMTIKTDNGLIRSDTPDPTRVDVTTRQGQTYSEMVPYPLGSLERPMSFEDCAQKFKACAKKLKAHQSDQIIEMVAHLEKLDNLEKLTQILH